MTDRLAALAEVVLCSGFPTQLAVAVALQAAGYRSLDAAGRLSRDFVVALSLADAALVVALVLWFLRAHGERPRQMFLGERPLVRESLLGVPLMVVVLGLVLVVLGVVQIVAPVLHNVPRNPLQDMIRTPRDAWTFGAVVVISGGFREEIQRAFVLRRFEQYLGGRWLGLVVFSVVFGAGHVIQGWDVALTIATLGAFWGIVYLRRRSIAAPVVSHAGFNVIEVFRYTLYGS